MKFCLSLFLVLFIFISAILYGDDETYINKAVNNLSEKDIIKAKEILSNIDSQNLLINFKKYYLLALCNYDIKNKTMQISVNLLKTARLFFFQISESDYPQVIKFLKDTDKINDDFVDILFYNIHPLEIEQSISLWIEQYAIRVEFLEKLYDPGLAQKMLEGDIIKVFYCLNNSERKMELYGIITRIDSIWMKCVKVPIIRTTKDK